MAAPKEFGKAARATGRPWQLKVTVVDAPIVKDDNLLVTTADMKVGAYTLAATEAGDGLAHPVICTHTQNVEPDTMGTVDIVGTDQDGAVISETIIPVDASEVSTILEFLTITSITGVGWITGGTADSVIFGMDVTNAYTAAVPGIKFEDKIVFAFINAPTSGADAGGLDDVSDEISITNGLTGILTLTTTDPVGKQLLVIWYDVLP